MIFGAQLVGASEIIVPPDSRVWKNVSRSTSLRDRVVDDVAASRGPCTACVSQVSIQKDSMRTISFCSSPIEPDTSIM